MSSLRRCRAVVHFLLGPKRRKSCLQTLVRKDQETSMDRRRISRLWESGPRRRRALTMRLIPTTKTTAHHHRRSSLAQFAFFITSSSHREQFPTPAVTKEHHCGCCLCDVWWGCQQGGKRWYTQGNGVCFVQPNKRPGLNRIYDRAFRKFDLYTE